MIKKTFFEGKRIHVFGLGLSGLATAKFLKKNHVDVSVGDDDITSKQAWIHAEKLYSIETKTIDFSCIDILVLSPGIALHFPKPHPIVVKARQAKTVIMSDIDLFLDFVIAQEETSQFIAITGTNGKSTTTSLLTHCLNYAGKDAVMLGNIGIPVFSLDNICEHKIYILEVSSYHIDLFSSRSQFDIAALTNITVDHIDRHGSFEQYRDTKYALFLRHLKSMGCAVINIDDHECYELYRDLDNQQTVRVQGVSHTRSSEVEEGVVAMDGHLVIRRPSSPDVNLIALDTMSRLRGKHNWQNASIVTQICLLLKIDRDIIAQALQSFPGLAHRMEYVTRDSKVVFINDSKATNAEATQHALMSYNSVFWIVGGVAKQGGIESLYPHFKDVICAYLIGESMDEFARICDKHDLSYKKVETLENAVSCAYKDAVSYVSQDHEPAVVLLSPACASFDQFKNFEHRGDTFKKCIQIL